MVCANFMGARVQEISNKGEVTKRSLRAAEKLLKPTRIEEVPFRWWLVRLGEDAQKIQKWFISRRQDRRTLNARYRRKMDRRLILCIAGSSLVLLALGEYQIFLGKCECKISPGPCWKIPNFFLLQFHHYPSKVQWNNACCIIQMINSW